MLPKCRDRRHKAPKKTPLIPARDSWPKPHGGGEKKKKKLGGKWRVRGRVSMIRSKRPLTNALSSPAARSPCGDEHVEDPVVEDEPPGGQPAASACTAGGTTASEEQQRTAECFRDKDSIFRRPRSRDSPAGDADRATPRGQARRAPMRDAASLRNQRRAVESARIRY